MSDYYLKAADESAMWAVLEATGLVQTVEDQRVPLGVALDVIGTIYKPTGQTQTVDGMEVPAMAPIQGFHANLRGELTTEQVAALPLVPEPSTPYRVWA